MDFIESDKIFFFFAITENYYVIDLKQISKDTQIFHVQPV